MILNDIFCIEMVRIDMKETLGILINLKELLSFLRNYVASMVTRDVGKMIYHLVKQIYHYAQDRKFNG